ncbi:MAG: hypothetical protein IT233_04255 [Bacteroidia bacterium]|nr:hypothetical protein [Bacteroidia bacterium]
MKALVITPKNQAEIRFLADLLKKLGFSSTVMEKEQIEDAGMSMLMKQTDRSKKVSRDSIMKKLKS